VERNRLLVSKLSSGLFLAFSFLHLVAIVIGAALRRGGGRGGFGGGGRGSFGGRGGGFRGARGGGFRGRGR